MWLLRCDCRVEVIRGYLLWALCFCEVQPAVVPKVGAITLIAKGAEFRKNTMGIVFLLVGTVISNITGS